jgi:hypothetical protein
MGVRSPPFVGTRIGDNAAQPLIYERTRAGIFLNMHVIGRTVAPLRWSGGGTELYKASRCASILTHRATAAPSGSFSPHLERA